MQTQCQYLTAAQLIEAAEWTKDESILSGIQNVDCFVRELRYHPPCYATYFLKNKNSGKVENSYDVWYDN